MKNNVKTRKEITSDQFNPETDSGWLWTGDNLAIMTGLDDQIVDLIYLDPPFNSKENYINVFNTADQSIQMQFNDIWTPTEDDDLVLEMIGEKREFLPDYINAVGNTVDESMRSYLIFMAIRLLEMHRIMKDTASIYLHCDPTASHYLKSIMDGIFGYENFQNEIIWLYGLGGSSPKRYSKKHDVILFYTKTDDYYFDKPREEATSHRMAGQLKGMRDVWIDIPSINNKAKERTGYPTQKPLVLLERIIKASSEQGNLVFDPFAGCATTVVSANRNSRRWISCDIAQSSVPILRRRIENDTSGEGRQLKTGSNGLLQTEVINPIDLPTSNYSKQIENSKKLRQIIAHVGMEKDKIKYVCNGCDKTLPIRDLEIDYIQPISRGGNDTEENRILLCYACKEDKAEFLWEEWKNEPFKKKNRN